MKKALSLILALIMCMSATIILPVTASAKDVGIAEDVADSAEEAIDVDEDPGYIEQAPEKEDFSYAETGSAACNDAYYRFVRYRYYLNYFSVRDNSMVKFSLIDLDADGTPELVVLNLSDFDYSGAAYKYYIFSYRNDSVQLVTGVYLHCSLGAYTGSNKYYGAFGGFADGYNRVSFFYCYLKGDQLISQAVAVYPNSNTLTCRTSDKNLYKAFCNATKQVKKQWYGTTYTTSDYLFPVTGYTYNEIINMGWDSYLSKYPYLATPKLTGISNVYGGVNIKWGKVRGAEKYRVYRKTGSGSWVKIADTTALSYTDKKAKSGAAYSYCVKCLSGDGTYFTGVMKSSMKSIRYIAAPVPKKCVVGLKGIKLTWGAVKGAAKYRVFIKSGSIWKKLADTKSRSYTYTGVKSGATYTFTIRCISANGKSYTSGYNTNGWAKKFVSAPKITKLKSATNGVSLTWSKSKGASKYRVLIMSGSKWKKLADTTKNTYTHTAAKSGKKYQYTVVCITSDAKSATSAYYTKGWSITYKKPVDWKNLYKNYVNSHLNSMPWGSSTFKVGSSTPFIMHDLDMNGIPELLVGSIGNHLSVQVYTIYGGKVVYAGGLGGRSVDYSTNKSYHGVFCWYVNGIGGSGGLGYYAVSKGKLSKKDVMVYSYNQNTKKRSETVKNQTLYSVYKNSTKNLSEYSWSDIQSNGWNAFFKKYGY